MTSIRRNFVISALVILILANVGYYGYLYKDFKKKNPGTANIYITTIPKSASDHITDMMRSILHYSAVNLTRGHFPEEYFYPEVLDHIQPNAKTLFKQHISPTIENLEKYRRITDKMVLHLRDPREVLLSWVHHLESDYQPDRILEEGYYSKTFEEKLDWNIEHSLPRVVAWMQGWLEIKQREDLKTNGMKILITTYDEMVKDELALYKKIIKFYDLSLVALENYQPKAKTESRHFRKGDRNEWRTVFNAEQKQNMAEIIPPELLKQFNWDPSYD